MLYARLAQIVERTSPHYLIPAYFRRKRAAEEYRKLVTELLGDQADEQAIEYLLFEKGGPPVVEFREMDIFERLGWLESLRARLAEDGSAATEKRIEWSRLVKQLDLRNKLDISQDTLRDRLIDSTEPIEGKYRCRRSRPTDRKIMVAIADLPEHLHPWLRKQINAG